jgi:hypothetical protein
MAGSGASDLGVSPNQLMLAPRLRLGNCSPPVT